jgi:hypothetical protein
MKVTDIVLVITAVGGVVFGALERWERIEQIKAHNYVVAEIAGAAQKSGEAAR